VDVGVGKGWVEIVGGVRWNPQRLRFSSQKLAARVLSCENCTVFGGGWRVDLERPLKGR
jgi:hypothetical protein